MQETCQFTFRTSRGRNRVVSIVDPRSGLTAAQANNAAGMFMSCNPFDAETGALVSLVRVDIVQTERTPIIAPPSAA